ncbi:MAG: acyltransferase [Acidovorax sp.]|nr:MAG: acyltransferase [Acidovorax sp.]
MQTPALDLQNKSTAPIVESKNSAIETLRAAAVLLVFAHHMHSASIFSIPFIGETGGWIGIQIFFVISGYLIVKSAARYSALDYVRHRALRIYPAYILWFLVFSVWFGNLKPGSIDVKSLVIHLLFLQHLFPEAYFKYNALRVSWTLTVEMIWYVTAFLFVAVIHSRPSKTLALVVLAACFWVYGGHHLLPFYKTLDAGNSYFFVNNHTIAQLPFFFMGAWISVKQPKFDNAALFGIFVGTIILSPAWLGSFPSPIFMTGLGVASLFLLLQNIQYHNPRPVRILSDISYSFYLIHYPIIFITSQSVHNKFHQVLVSLVATIVVAYASYRLVEQPFIGLARKRKQVEQATV